MTPLALLIDQILPQTQCMRCGYADCAQYAEAIAESGVPINQCPPGGEKGIHQLAVVSNQSVSPLNPKHGSTMPLRIAKIDEQHCIGCTLCIQVCPTDAIMGTSKRMHTVVEDYCTGCELCLPVCPVDCIEMMEHNPLGQPWPAWSAFHSAQARKRYHARRERLKSADCHIPAAKSTVLIDGATEAKQRLMQSVLRKARTPKPLDD